MTYDDQLTAARRAALWAQIDERNAELAMMRKPAQQTPWDAPGVPVRRFGDGWDAAFVAITWTVICLAFFALGLISGMAYAAWRFAN